MRNSKYLFLFFPLLIAALPGLTQAALPTGEVIPGVECGARDPVNGTLCQFFAGRDPNNHDLILLVGGGGPGGHGPWDPNFSMGYLPIENIRGASVINIATRSGSYSDGTSPTFRKNVDDMKRAISESLEWFKNNKDPLFSGKWYWIGSSYGAVLGSLYLPILSQDLTAKMPTAFALDSPYAAFHWGAYVAPPEEALPDYYQQLLFKSVDCSLSKPECEEKVKEIDAALQFDAGDLDIPTLFAEGDLDERKGRYAADQLHLRREALGKNSYGFVRFAQTDHVPLELTLNTWTAMVDFLYDRSCAIPEALVVGGSLCGPETAPPSISQVSASGITETSTTISWLTNEVADSQIEYGTSTSYGFSTQLDGALVTSHSQVLSGLSPKTLYHFRVKSRDAAGNLAVSGDFTFTTPDTTSPTVLFTSPQNGAVVKGVVSIEISAKDNVGVAKIELWLDGGNLLGSKVFDPAKAVVTASFSLDTRGPLKGNHILTAIAYDSSQNKSSTSITVKAR